MKARKEPPAKGKRERRSPIGAPVEGSGGKSPARGGSAKAPPGRKSPVGQKAGDDPSARLRAANRKLREAELRYRTVADFAYDWEYWVHPDGKLRYVSPSAERITGYRPEAFLENPRLRTDIVVPEDRRMWKRHTRQKAARAQLREIQFRIRREDGQVRWIEHACVPVTDRRGRFLGYRASNRDVTDRKKTEEMLVLSETHFRRAQEVANLGSWDLDIARNRLSWSDEVYRIFGISPGSSLTYEKFLDRVYPDDRTYVEARWQAAMNRELYDIEHRIVVDGQVKWVREKAEVEFDREGRPLRGVGIVQDISAWKSAQEDIRRLEDDLRRVSRVHTLGELTAALAHEINQPLAAILSNAQAAQRLLASKPPDLDELREILADIVEAYRHAGEIIHRLRGMIRKDRVEMAPTDLNDVILEVLRLVRTDTATKHVSISTDLDLDLPPALGDRVQLQQVLLNLILNASEAMMALQPEKRRLVIITKRAADHHLKAEVRDFGPGVEAGSLEKIFEPFHTTKTGGLGMGLAIARGIINGHRGKLLVENNPDGGATFSFTLPVHPSA